MTEPNPESADRPSWAPPVLHGGRRDAALRTDSDWIADTVRFVVARKRRWSGGGVA